MKLEQQLQTLHLEKQRMEVEYSKMPSVGSGASVNSAALRKRREDLEADMDVTQKTISVVKQKLREMNAL
jgi:hypothetical protein